jgi:hypothetical protein
VDGRGRRDRLAAARRSRLIAGARERGENGVGFQSHVLCLFGYRDTFAALGASLARVSDLCVDVAITELDVDLPEPVTAAALAEQADTYPVAIDACLAVARCRTFVSGASPIAIPGLRPSGRAGLGAALPFDEEPACWALHDRLRRATVGTGAGGTVR